MAFEESLKALDAYLNADAQAIKDLLTQYRTNPITVKTAINLNAYDYVVPFSTDPIKGVQANKDLAAKNGNYVFVITKSVTRRKDFNNVWAGAPLKDSSVKVFNPNDILYLGTASKFLARMHQHFAKDYEYNRTGSLKLGSDERNNLLGNIIVYAFCIRKKYKDYYPFIGPKVEKYLHENLPVLVGND